MIQFQWRIAPSCPESTSRPVCYTKQVVPMKRFAETKPELDLAICSTSARPALRRPEAASRLRTARGDPPLELDHHDVVAAAGYYLQSAWRRRGRRRWRVLVNQASATRSTCPSGCAGCRRRSSRSSASGSVVTSPSRTSGGRLRPGQRGHGDVHHRGPRPGRYGSARDPPGQRQDRRRQLGDGDDHRFREPEQDASAKITAEDAKNSSPERTSSATTS